MRVADSADLLERMKGWIVRRIGWARLIAAGLVAFAVFVRIVDPIPLKIARNLVFDFYQQQKPRLPQPFPVAIIDIDDPSLAEVGQWPWPRSRFAELVDKAMADGAVAIGFDIIFAERDRLSPVNVAIDNPGLPEPLRAALQNLPDNDRLLADAFARGRVVVGQTSVRRTHAVSSPGGPVMQVPHAVVGLDPAPFVLTLPELVQNLPELEAAAAGHGVFNVRPDPDGVYRRAPMVVSIGGTLRLGLGPELLRVGSGGGPFAIRTNEAGIDGVVLAGKLVPTAGDGTVQPYLTPSLRARFVSAGDLLSGRMPAGRLAGHLVLVGTSAIGLEDYRATALGVQMAGVEIHAQMLENILSDSLLVRPNYAVAVELVVTVAFSLILIVLTPIMNAYFLISSSAIFLGSLAWVSFNAFVTRRVLIDATFPIWAGLATIIFMLAANYLREERRRQRIRLAFGQYVSRDLVTELIDNQESLKLGGETRELTLLFSDVRGFTAIAESYRDNPAGLTSLMNRLLNGLSAAILGEKGTIDKFMGDAVMAFWNAPMDHARHQKAACTAALKMVDHVERLNSLRRAEAEAALTEFQPMHIGIGINTGSCTVGNMGSDTRFDYTAMGDPVNLASRLEGQSRYYGTAIIVGSPTEAAVHADFALLELDLVRVKGKSQPERIFALLGDCAMRESEEFVQAAILNRQMLAAMRGQQWDAAEAGLASLEPMAVAFDPRLATHFIGLRERIAHFRANPPPTDWDGVHDATSK